MSVTETPEVKADESPLASDRAKLAEAQRNRAKESVGPSPALGVVRRTTADELDAHRDWTVQSGRPFPGDQGRTTHFHPDELPEPQKAVDAGLLPQLYPAGIIDPDHVTQTPFSDVSLDHPSRAKNRGSDPGYAASQATGVAAGLEAAEAQRSVDKDA